jgi:hypothetical protein
MSEGLVVLLYSSRILTGLTRPFNQSVSLTNRVEQPDSMSGPRCRFFLFWIELRNLSAFLQGKGYSGVCRSLTLRTNTPPPPPTSYLILFLYSTLVILDQKDGRSPHLLQSVVIESQFSGPHHWLFLFTLNNVISMLLPRSRTAQFADMNITLTLHCAMSPPADIPPRCFVRFIRAQAPQKSGGRDVI